MLAKGSDGVRGLWQPLRDIPQGRRKAVVWLAVLWRSRLEDVVRDDRATSKPRSRDQSDARASNVRAASIDTKARCTTGHAHCTSAESAGSIGRMLDALRTAILFCQTIESRQTRPLRNDPRHAGMIVMLATTSNCSPFGRLCVYRLCAGNMTMSRSRSSSSSVLVHI